MFEKEKKQYEDDCKNHERPWELWQYTSSDQSSSEWHSLETHPTWSGHCIYHRKQTTFVPEYYSGLNWRNAEHLIGKVIEYTNHPDSGWHVGMLTSISKNNVIAHFDIIADGEVDFFVYIRTCEEAYQHPTINIGGVELPMPETAEPALGTKYWLSPACNEMVWCGYYSNIDNLQSGRVHLTEERAKAWADWWKATVIDKMK